MSATLSHWLRLLWGQSPALHLDSEAPFIAAGAIHLPACPHWLQQRAAAAHAAAHLVYSRSPSGRRGGFDVSGLGPIARALLALLEDARAEALACRELPGLARLWQPLHTATPHDGNGFEALMQRLARALADPGYDDPHPWVRKGVGLFYLDVGLRLLALRTPAELRVAALRLGHDIGQMRLPFNAKTYRPAPAYRDDHRWMWPADDLAAADLPPPASGAAPGETHTDDDSEAAATVTHHPEWDRLISRLRPAWCRVVERAAPSIDRPIERASQASAQAGDAHSHRLRGPLRALGQRATHSARHHEGEVFDIDAVVQAGVARRVRCASDTRVYRAPSRRTTQAVVCVLVDQSASTAACASPDVPADGSVLQVAGRSAQALARALRGLGVACTVAGFSSNGRHAVRVLTVKRLRDAADAALAARLQSLRPGGSTRLGAALRHAAAACAAAPARHGAARWVLVLSDGQAHDVDVHDPRYLVEDARHAVRSAARQTVRVVCLRLSSHDPAAARRIFGPRGVQALASLDALPRALQRLLA